MPPTPDNTHVTFALVATLELTKWKWTGALTAKTTNIPTYADLDTTDHFFVDQGMFVMYQELPEPIKGHAAPKGALFQVIGKGMVKRVCWTAQGSSELIFKNVLHAPDLVSNLISINCFNKAGFQITFGGGQV